MKLVAAQLRALAGDIDGNIQRHIAVIERAASDGAAVVVFPELSLTGYEPRMAQRLAMSCDDPRLEVFQALSDRDQMLIAVGAPHRGQEGIEIGMFVFRCGEVPVVYAKQMLHADEQPYFHPGDRPMVFPLHGAVIAPAICYESLQTAHADAAVARGATVYLASVAKAARGVDTGYRHYPAIAQHHGLTVMMANGVGPADDFVMAGRSAVWRTDGTCVCSADAEGEALVVYDLATQVGEVLPMGDAVGAAHDR
ncbi:carbon-nitrogen hydrolase family protein [Stenotrophomonas sp. HMWF003]|uniref:carbon-nitrogen hydrolase family protein n=1 Tax=Stenotrophomonas sp. HMWF003 TaxID=2056840 RepID=UPI000D3FA561|nr:carbon-nitrogen hydrolase family protein [Stenotrophomonas sp. HMWF003]PTT61356.1 carbon-nitrogen hydrolase family protein [Stenotrophomonas sp. HMWF003]